MQVKGYLLPTGHNKILMMFMPPEDLTMEELRAIETVIRGAIDRASRPVGNVVRLADRRR